MFSPTANYFLRVPLFTTTRENLILMHSLEKKKKKKRRGNIYSILKQRSGLASTIKYICTRLCMMHRQLTGATRMTSTQTHTAARIISCKMRKHIPSPSQTKSQLYAALPLWKKEQNEKRDTKIKPLFFFFHYTALWCSSGVCINMCMPGTR